MNESRFKILAPSCPICNKAYDLYYHVPRVLPKCGHTFCEKCIQSKIANKRGKINFNCFHCNSETIIRKNVSDQLPKNVSIVDLVKQAKYKTIGQTKTEPENICVLHNTKLDMICVTCSNVRICAHCAIFGSHKGHQISHEQIVNSQDIKQLTEFIEVLEDTVNQTLLPTSPTNIEKQSILKLRNGLQAMVKQIFKQYYTQISKKQNELLEQCQEIVIDDKKIQSIDTMLSSYDLLKLRAQTVDEKMGRSKVEEMIQSAKELHNQIQKLVQSYHNSVQAYLLNCKIKLRQISFFGIQLCEKRNLKSILNGETIDPKKKQNGMKSSNIFQRQSQSNKILHSQNTERKSVQSGFESQILDNNKTKTPAIPLPKGNKDKLTLKAQQRQKVKKYDSFLLEDQICLQPPKRQSKVPLLKTLQRKPQSMNKTPQKMERNQSKQKQKQAYQTNGQIDLKFIKPVKQPSYAIRNKLQIIFSQIDRQSEGVLELIGLQIEDTHIPYICQYFQSKKLKYNMIKLVKNAITDEGLRILLSYLCGDTYTKVLNMTTNNLTPKCLPIILGFIERNKILKNFYLSHNKISIIQLKKVQKSFEQKYVQIVI